MKLLFVYSHKFMKHENKYYSSGPFPYELFKSRYLEDFEKVTICSRLTKVNDEVNNYVRSDGKNVLFTEMPNLSVIRKRKNLIRSTQQILEQEIAKANAVVARMPSEHAYLAIKIALKWNKPLVVEVVGDIFESLWNHGSIFGKLLAPIYNLKYKRIIKLSKYTIYVTNEQLQLKYPSSKEAYTINASNVELDATSESVLLRKIKKENYRPLNKLKIGLIGSYATKYKGIHNGIDLIKYLQKQGVNAELHILGSGNNKWLIDRAKKNNVNGNIFFHGSLPSGEPVLEWLDTLDLYIQPSLTEGLPRALIEAMSRGLPAVASSVGGIPELLDEELLHKPNDSVDLIKRVVGLINNKQLILSQIERNFWVAQQYSKSVLQERRKKFWEYFIDKELLK